MVTEHSSDSPHVFVVHHENPATDDVKLIGVFASAGDAQDAVAALSVKPGFRDSPEGFDVDRHRIGALQWTSGFGPG